MDTPLKDSYQQGDVTFRRIGPAVRPQKYVFLQKGRCIVAEGEGHHVHVVDAPETDAELIREGDRMLLLLHKPAAVRHEVANAPGTQADHKPRTLEAGLWEVGGVREVDHFAQLERRVID
jgi:hypothetical protein